MTTAKIWLPDDKTGIAVDVKTDTVQGNECTVYQERITMTLQPIQSPRGFGKEGKGK